MPSQRSISSIAIGNTGVEALAATIAQKLFPGHKKQVEEQLEALELSDRFRSQQLDRGAQFRQARQSFTVIELLNH